MSNNEVANVELEVVELVRVPQKRHPIQPLEVDEHGTLRYKKNQIVRDLLDVASKHGLDMNTVAVRHQTGQYTADDRIQLTQLIGYSHSGAGGLSYFPEHISAAAEIMHEKGVSEEQARLENLTEVVVQMQQLMREPMSLLYNVAPEDIFSGDTGFAPPLI